MPANVPDLRVLQTRASQEAAHEIERFAAQAEFVRGLAELHPRQGAAWLKLLARATETVATAANGSPSGLRAAVRRAEDLLAPAGAAAKQYTVHCVGHAHIDMNWMWSWPETVAATNDTFGTVLRLMDEFPAFRFSQSQASVYAIIEKYNPAMLPRIAARVREGRWEVTASHWVEGDKNLANGESLCRHLLYTRRYLARLFGLTPADVAVDWSPDTFGHAATIPSYLVRGGVKYYYLHRPGVHGPARPGAFWWQAPDGSRVLVRNDMALAYNGRIGPELGRHLLGFARETGGKDYMFVYGVGDHGGGPTRRDVLRALDMDAWPVFPNIRFSTTRAFFTALERLGAKLPTLTCELNTEFTGCYTSQSLIKKANRFSENRLADAELAALTAWAACGSPYPADDLREGWQDTLFSHFHDILPGSGVHDTRTYTHGLFQKTMAMTSMVEMNALRQLAARINTSAAAGEDAPAPPPTFLASGLGSGVGFGTGDGRLSGAEQSAGQGNRPFVLFNPTGAERAEVFEVTIWDNAPIGAKPLKERTFSVRLNDGTVVPAQVAAEGNYWAHQYLTLAFPARVPAFGYTQCTVVEEATPVGRHGAWHLGYGHHCRYARFERSPEGLENDLIRVELDPGTGGIHSLRDKRSGVELIAPAQPAPALEYIVERPHGMSSWNVDHAAAPEVPTVVSIQRKHKGPHKAALEVVLRIHESDFTLTYEVRAGEPLVYLTVAGTWFQRGTKETGVPTLRLAFPLALRQPKARYEIPFGAVDREVENGVEVPALQWAQVSGAAGGKRAGCLLLNDCKYGHSLDGNVLRLTLIRGSYEPDILPEIGRHEIRTALAPFAGVMPVAEATRLGRALNHPVRVVGATVHEGDLPAEDKLFTLAPGSVVVSGIKKAEDSDALIIRLYETAGRKTTARLRLNEALLGKVSDAVEVDMQEQPLAKSSARRAARGAVSVSLPAFGIATVRVGLKRR